MHDRAETLEATCVQLITCCESCLKPIFAENLDANQNTFEFKGCGQCSTILFAEKKQLSLGSLSFENTRKWTKITIGCVRLKPRHFLTPRSAYLVESQCFSPPMYKLRMLAHRAGVLSLGADTSTGQATCAQTIATEAPARCASTHPSRLHCHDLNYHLHLLNSKCDCKMKWIFQCL